MNIKVKDVKNMIFEINFEECKSLHNEVSASIECEQCSKKDECYESEE